jgi:hypothetical protein
MPEAPTDALATRPNGPVLDLQFDKQGLPVFAQEAQRVAYVSMMLKAGFFPSHITTVSQALSCIDLLSAMGLPWQAWIGKTYVIGGKPAVMIEALLAAAHGTGQVEYLKTEFVDEDNNFMTRENVVKFKVFGCVVTGKRKDQPEPQMAAYTMNDVAAAGMNNPNYKKHPKDMLMWRAMGRCLKSLWPLTCGGPLAQGINDGYEAMLDDTGAPMRTAQGQDVMVRRVQRKDTKALDAMFSSEGVKQDGA